MYDSPRNGKSMRNFEATKRSVFGQKSDDARQKRQSMQIYNHSLGIKKFLNTPARTNSNGNTNNYLASPMMLQPPNIQNFNINSDSEGAFDGSILKEDSLRSSKDIKQNSLFNKSINYKSGVDLDLDEQKYSETPKESVDGFDYKFSLSKHNADSKMDHSIENSLKNAKNSNAHLKAPPQDLRENSRGSKEEGNPILPIRPSSKRRMKKRISSRNKRSRDN
jgi:hypothetical protein